MGNRNGNLTTTDANFPMQKYINSGLSPQAVLKIKEAFETYEPSADGYISVDKFKDMSKESADKKMIDERLAGLDRINFDQFF